MKHTIIKNNICDFCGEQRKWTASNTFHGHYCPDCLNLSRAEDLECLHDIQEACNEEGLTRKTKKVFSVDAFDRDMGECFLGPLSWPYRCEGLTADEMWEQQHCTTRSEWMVEVEDDD